ncbi:MAG TPA: aminoglycoside phosphotransferase family protein [Solirubrobacteraceae bacterium]|nr:aminoglycoside phosphotransferase family protein [Solirubrobacteraceae bacterium]
MFEQLEIEGGPMIWIQGRPAQGTRHEVLYGALPNTGEPVVVKLERTPGALENEQRALAAFGTHNPVAPRLLAAGAAVIRGQRVACLVTERRPGSPPTTTDGWWRMGRALARLTEMRLPLGNLTVLDPVTFARRHAQRLNDLGDRLLPLARSIPDWPQLASPKIPASTPLVITHGDPGPGNYLDNGNEGTLIDWEETHIAPRGLDLARLAFIALLGAGPNGYLARDHQARADAAADGYLSALRESWRPARQEARWWTTVAGIQFVHRRWQLGGRPAPWEDAAETLHSALTKDRVWPAADNTTPHPFQTS